MNREVNEALAARSNGKPELISAQAKELLNLRRLPAMLNIQQTAVLLGLAEHDIPVLIGVGLLKPLGDPPPNAVKHFASIQVLEMAGGDDDEGVKKVASAIITEAEFKAAALWQVLGEKVGWGRCRGTRWRERSRRMWRNGCWRRGRGKAEQLIRTSRSICGAELRGLAGEGYCTLRALRDDSREEWRMLFQHRTRTMRGEGVRQVRLRFHQCSSNGIRTVRCVQSFEPGG